MPLTICQRICHFPCVQTNARKGRKARERFQLSEFINPSGEVAWRVSGTLPDGTRVRENFRLKAEAVGRRQELEIAGHNIKTDLAARLKPTRLTDAQVRECEAALAALTKAGRSSVLEAVRFYLDNWREPVTRIAVGDALARFLEEKAKANLRPQSLDNLRIKTRPLLVLHGHQTVDELQPDALRALIHVPSRGPKSRDNYRRALSSFFGWAQRQGYCADNPCAKIDPIKADRHEPDLLTVSQCAALLTAATEFKEGRLLPYVVLGLFAGLRPTELARLTWNRVDLDAGTITVDASMAKMRARRIVSLSANAVALLRPLALRRLPILGPNWRRDFDAVKEAAGITTWPQDVMRHTAISMHLAAHQHEGQTATWAGNSPDIIQKHYKGLVRPAEAAAFWQLSAGEAGNIVKLDKAA